MMFDDDEAHPLFDSRQFDFEHLTEELHFSIDDSTSKVDEL